MDLFDLVAKLSLDQSEYENGLDKAEKSANGMGGKLQKAFGVATKAGAGLAGGAVAAGAAIYGMATKSAATSDHIDKMSQKLGISREAYQEMDFVASQCGTSVDGMRAGMKTLVAQMNQADSGSKSATSAFEALGISIYDSNGNLKDQETMLWESLSALNEMEEGTEKTTLATQLFGKAGTELAPMLNGAVGSIDDMRQQAHDLGLVLSDETIDAGVHLTDTIDQMQRSFSAIATEVGKEVMPIVQEALQFVVEHVPQIREVVSTVFGVLEGYVDWFVNAVKTYVLPTVQSIVDFVTSVFAGDWESAWQNARQVFMNAWDGLSSFFSDLFGNAAEAIQSVDWVAVGTAILDFITSVFTDLTQWATDFYNTASEAIKSVDWVEVGNTIWDTIASAFDAIGDAFAAIFQTGSDGAEEGVDWAALGSAILGYVESAFDAIGTVFVTIFNRAYTAITEDIDWVALGQSIFDAIGEAFKVLASTFQALFEGAKVLILKIDWGKLGQDIFDTIGEAFKNLASTFQSLFEGAKEWVLKVDWLQLGKDIFDKIGEAFKNIASTFQALFEGAKSYILKIDWVQLGKDIFGAIGEAFMNVAGTFQSIFEGARDWIKDHISWSQLGTDIWEMIKGGFTGILDFFTGLFDFSNIHIKLPHFNVEWHDWGWLSTPSISVEWYKKAMAAPYMFSDATFFGAGEAGDEMLYGHNNLMNDIKEAVASVNKNDRLYDLLNEYLPEILESTNKDIVLDDGTLMGHIDTSLGWGSAAAARGA